jgi:hypothetical protein
MEESSSNPVVGEKVTSPRTIADGDQWSSAPLEELLRRFAAT